MPSPIIDVDVGGKVFRASVASLSRSPVLQNFLRYSQQGGIIPAGRTSDGHVFIDRSPELFKDVLDVLRSDGDTDLRVSSTEDAKRLVREFDYYGLDASLSEQGEERVNVSARFLSGKLHLHVSATSSLFPELDEQSKGSKLATYSDTLTFHGVSLGLCQYSCDIDNVCASDIPMHMSGIADVFVAMGFIEDHRSESCSLSFAPQHWVNHFMDSLVNADVAGCDIEWMAYDSAMLHWVSETVSYTRRKGPVIHVKSPQAYFSEGDDQTSDCSIHLSSHLGHIDQHLSACPSALREGSSSPGPADDCQTTMSSVEITRMSGGAHGASSPVSGELVHEELQGGVESVQESVQSAHVTAEQAGNEVEGESEVGRCKTNSKNTQGGQNDLDDTMRALQLSKEEPVPLNSDGVVIFRLLRMADHADVQKALLESEVLADCRRRVHAANCEIVPSWANGARLFVPCTEQQLLEIDFEFKSYHILALREDRQAIQKALQIVSKKNRPGVSAESMINDVSSNRDSCHGVEADGGLLEEVRAYVGTDSSIGFGQYPGL